MRWSRCTLLPFTLLAGCVSWTAQREVLISSEPLGAHIAIDGNDTGKTTPARLTLGGYFGTGHTVLLTKPGYRPAARRLYRYDEGYTSRLVDAAFAIELPPLPLFWNAGDLLFPFAVRSALMPGELYVQLDKEDAPLLGFDVLAARTAAATPVAGVTSKP